MDKILYKIVNIETHEIMLLTVSEILEEINRDRSDEWQDYDESDWREGLDEFCYPLRLIEKGLCQGHQHSPASLAKKGIEVIA
jgi:hypothetical protein